MILKLYQNQTHLNKKHYILLILYVDLNKLNSYVEKEFKKVVINQNSDEEYAKMFDSIRSIAYYKTLSGRYTLVALGTIVAYSGLPFVST